jgi:hypothetical protein
MDRWDEEDKQDDSPKDQETTYQTPHDQWINLSSKVDHIIPYGAPWCMYLPVRMHDHGADAYPSLPDRRLCLGHRGIVHDIP